MAPLLCLRRHFGSVFFIFPRYVFLLKEAVPWDTVNKFVFIFLPYLLFFQQTYLQTKSNVQVYHEQGRIHEGAPGAAAPVVGRIPRGQVFSPASQNPHQPWCQPQPCPGRSSRGRARTAPASRESRPCIARPCPPPLATTPARRPPELASSGLRPSRLHVRRPVRRSRLRPSPSGACARPPGHPLLAAGRRRPGAQDCCRVRASGSATA